MQQQLEIIVTFRKGGQDALPQIQTGAKSVMNSIDGLNTKIKYYEGVAKKAEIGTREYANAIKQAELASKQMGTAQLVANKNMQGTTRQTAQMTMTLQAMNFTIRDSPYFFRDFSLGILAIGNNLNPLIDGLINVKREAKLAGTTLRSSLWNALKGPGGVIFAFSVLVSVLQAVIFAMAKTKQESKELKDTLSEFDNIPLIDINRQIGTIETLMSRKEKSFAEKLLKNASDNARPSIESDIKSGAYKEYLREVDEEYNRMYETLNKLRNVVSAGRGIIPDMRAEIEQLKKLRDGAQDLGLIKSFNVQIAQKEAELNAILGKQRVDRIKNIEDEYEAMGLLTHLYGNYVDVLTESSKYPSSGYDGDTAVGLPGTAQAILKKKRTDMPDLDDTKKNMAGINSLANTLGTTIWNAFSQGKFAADEFLKSLLSIAAQMVIIEGLKAIFSGGSYSMFSFLSQGGVVKASGGYMTGGNGTHDYIPALLRPREMVLNPNQQAELFHMAKGLGNGGGSQRVDIRLSGEVTESKNNFHYRVKKSSKHYNLTKGIS